MESLPAWWIFFGHPDFRKQTFFFAWPKLDIFPLDCYGPGSHWFRYDLHVGPPDQRFHDGCWFSHPQLSSEAFRGNEYSKGSDQRILLTLQSELMRTV